MRRDEFGVIDKYVEEERMKAYNQAIDDAQGVVSAETHNGTLYDLLEKLKKGGR